MAYDQEKDKLIKMVEYPTDEKGSALMFSIFSYSDGPKKLALTRSYNKKDGSTGYSQSGRLTLKEVEFLKDNIDEILELMK